MTLLSENRTLLAYISNSLIVCHAQRKLEELSDSDLSKDAPSHDRLDRHSAIRQRVRLPA